MTDVATDCPEFELEARDTELAISLWNQKAKQFGKPPPIAECALVAFASGAFRFVICADLLVGEDSVFLTYGPGFAKLLRLPERPAMHVPMLRYISDRYRFLFAEGCSEAIAEAAPVRFSGEITGAEGGAELYRACFMPLQMRNKNLQAIYGSFNYVTRPTAELREQSGYLGFTETGGSFPRRYLAQ